MSSLSTNILTLAAGEHRELVFVNEPMLNLHIVQEAGSSLRVHALYLPALPNQSGTNEAQITVEQQGEGCLTEIYGLAFLHGEEQVHLTTNVQHLIGGGSSRQLIKFVLDDASQGEFYGQLRIAPDAQKTEAHQTNRNLLLSEKALMRTRPQLEIYADDVKATHGATTGQLDESALFYMQQRCLDAQTARKLLINAFMQDVVNTISDEQRREELRQQITKL
ncbi:MAG: SufD family Fe-S cluster assembly protein [Paludibacteraceae bacterium]